MFTYTGQNIVRTTCDDGCDFVSVVSRSEIYVQMNNTSEPRNATVTVSIQSRGSGVFIDCATIQIHQEA